MSRGKTGIHFSLGTNAERLPGDHALARRPLERSANFGDCLVAIFVQFLESLLQRPKFSGTFGRPFPINIESVGRRWTGRRSVRGRQRRLHRCVVTVGGRHICTPRKLESGRIRSGGIFRVVARWRCEFAPCSVLFGCPAGVDLVAKDGRRRHVRLITSYSYGPPSPRLRCNRQPNFAGVFLCCSVIVRYVLTAFRNRFAAALRNLRDRHGQDRKAAPNRIAPARLRLQVRRLQPDHVGRAGAAGRNDPSPGSVDGADLRANAPRLSRGKVGTGFPSRHQRNAFARRSCANEKMTDGHNSTQSKHAPVKIDHT